MRSTLRPAPRVLASAAILLAGVFLFVPAASAQLDATISGVVTDPQGNPIANANVVVVAPDRGERRELRTNSEGRYIARGFRIDNYVIQVTADGFGPVEDQLKTNMGMNTFDVVLPLAQPAVDYDGLNKLYQEGFAAYQKKDWEVAESAMTELLGGIEDLTGDEVTTMRKSAMEVIGHSYVGQGNEEEALAAFTRLLEFDADSLTANSWLGELYSRRKEFETAAPYLKRAAELSPDDPAVQYNAGAIMLQVGDIEGGIAAMERAVELRPEFPIALKNLGYAYLRTQDYAKSIAALQKYLEASPDASDRADIEGMIEALKAQIQQ